MSSSPLIIDIETIGHDFDSFDKATQESLTRWIEKESETEADYERALADLKDGLGFSPLTGEIVAIGVFDHYKQQGVVYYQAPEAVNNKQATKDNEETPKEFVEGNITYKVMTEAGMLDAFWKGATQYRTFVSFNGRVFDMPFLALRSAICGVRPTKDLNRGRYLYQQPPDAIHIDLADQLSFYGASRKKGTLHLYTRAFGIKSPKADGVTGDEVSSLFKERRYVDIARYNAGDLFATSALYEKYNQYIRFS